MKYMQGTNVEQVVALFEVQDESRVLGRSMGSHVSNGSKLIIISNSFQ